MAKRRVSKPQKPRRPVLHGARNINCPHGIVLMVRCAMQTALNFMDYPHCRRAEIAGGRYSIFDGENELTAEIEAAEVYGWYFRDAPTAPPHPHQH